MRKIALPTTAALGTMFGLLLTAAPAHALTKTWVASNGSGATCSRAAPCATFQAAHDAADAGGEINCADAGDYGAVTISKAITIDCDNTQAGLKISSGNGIVVNAVTSDLVTLKGLVLDGSSTSAGLGLHILAAGAVHVHKLRITNFKTGINIATAAYLELYVADSHILGTNGGSGIAVQPGGSANVVISRLRLENNVTGMKITDAFMSGGGAINVNITDSVISGSGSDGIQVIANAGHPPVGVFIDRSFISGNFGSGIKADGAAASGLGSATVLLNDSSVVKNVTGVSTAGAGPGVVQSYKNNRISGNLTDGAPLPAVPGPGGTSLQ